MPIGNTCRERVKGKTVSLSGTVSFYAYPWLQDQMKQYHVGRLIEEDGCGERAQSSKKTMFFKLPLDFGAKVLHHHPILPVCFMPLEY